MTGATGRRLLFALAVLAQLVALYWPRPVDPESSLPVDKLVHAAIFGAVLWTGVRVGLRPGLLAAVLAVHAGVSEVIQGTVLDRDGNVRDVLADLVGIGVVWLWVSRPRRRSKTLAAASARRPGATHAEPGPVDRR